MAVTCESVRIGAQVAERRGVMLWLGFCRKLYLQVLIAVDAVRDSRIMDGTPSPADIESSRPAKSAPKGFEAPGRGYQLAAA